CVLVRVHGSAATGPGAAYLPFAVLVRGLSRWSGGLADRLGARVPLVAGPLVVAAGFLLFTVIGTDGSYWATFFPPMTLVGLGMAITVAPLTATVMAAVDESEVGVASGVNNTVARVATLLAVAVVGLIAMQAFGRELTTRVSSRGLSPAVRAAVAAERRTLGDVVLPEDTSADERRAVEGAVAEALVAAFQWAAALCAVLAAIAAGAAAIAIERAPARVPAAEVALASCAHLELIVDVAP